MSRAASYVGKELVINGKKFYIGLYKWPVQDDPESYFAALLHDKGSDQWETLIQLDPMPIDAPIKGAAATMNDILNVFNAKIAAMQSQPNNTIEPWISRLKKQFDNVVVKDGKIVTGI